MRGLKEAVKYNEQKLQKERKPNPKNNPSGS